MEVKCVELGLVRSGKGLRRTRVGQTREDGLGQEMSPFTPWSVSAP